MRHRIIVRLGGGIQFIYHDRLKPLLTHHAADNNPVRRVSHVEPTITQGPVEWTADMSPVGGPVLGPFPERQTALDAELRWLHAHPHTWRSPQ